MVGILAHIMRVLNGRVVRKLSFPAADLGIDGPEVREIFLAKIYELRNPSSEVETEEDDFLCEWWLCEWCGGACVSGVVVPV